MRRPCVSVVLPAFNAAAHIHRAVRSIREQTMPDWELVLVDDGSSDQTLSVIQNLADREPRLRLLSLEHGGIVSALNAGLAAARAPFIARMDADDEAHPDRLGEQLAFLEQRAEIGLVSCLVGFGGDRASARGYALHVDWMNSVINSSEIALERFVESPFAHPSVLFRRELIAQYGGYAHGAFPEDYELWLRWLDAGVVMAKVAKVLVTWNDSAKRLSRVDPRYDRDAFYRCKAVYLARWLRRQVDPERELLVWGAGRLTRRRVEYLTEQGLELSGYIDIDPRKIGRLTAGVPVLAPTNLPPPEACFVIGYVAKRGARDLARSHLQARGYVEGRDFLMAA